MALTPVKNRRASINFYTPTVRRIVSVDERINFGKGIIYRSVSCSELITHFPDSTSLRKFTKRDKDGLAYPFAKASSERDLRYSSCTLPRKSTTLKFRSPCNKMLLVIGSVLAIAISAVIVHLERNGYNNANNFAPIRKNLINSLLGQQYAIDSLERVWDIGRSHLVVVTGGVGVGKTVAAAAMWNHLPPSNRWDILTQNKLEPSLWSVPVYSFWSLLVIEDCDKNFNGQHAFVIKELFRKAGRYHSLFIVLVCTVINHNDREHLGKELDSIGYYEIVHFRTLDRNDVKECLIREIDRRGLVVTAAQLEEMISEQMTIVPEIGGTPGCKQVWKTVDSHLKS